jgi:hypothetical protein
VKDTVKQALKSCDLGRALYPRLQTLYRRYSVPRARRRLHTHGYEVLRRVDEIAARHGIPYFASYGTLLGLVRDGGFIAHDEDIDLGIVAGSVSPRELAEVFLRKEQGFDFARALEFRGRITEITLRCLGIATDFFFYERDGDRTFVTSYFWEQDRQYPSARANSVRLIYQATVTERKKIAVHGVEVAVPANSEELLASQYGPGWRVPDPGWDNRDHPGIVNQQEYGYAVDLGRVYEAGAQ